MAGQNGPRRMTLAELQYHRSAKPPPEVYRLYEGNQRCEGHDCQRWLNRYRPDHEGYCGTHRYCVVCSNALVGDELEGGVCDECLIEARKEQVSCQKKARVT